MNISKLYRKFANCSCKRKHVCNIKAVEIGEGALNKLTALCEAYTNILVVFDVKKRGNTESEDTLIVKEVYKHEHIGNANDLIIDDYKLGKIIFQNTDEIIDMREDSFVHKNNKYYFEDYIFVEVNVIKNVHSGEWMFKYFTIHNSDTIKNEFRKGNRLVIDELTGIIVVYNGFTK